MFVLEIIHEQFKWQSFFFLSKTAIYEGLYKIF